MINKRLRSVDAAYHSLRYCDSAYYKIDKFYFFKHISAFRVCVHSAQLEIITRALGAPNSSFDAYRATIRAFG